MANYTYRDFDADAHQLYDHLLDLRSHGEAEDLLRGFQCLFVVGRGYPDPVAQALVDRLLEAPWADKEFHHILNRSCYILINHWLMYPDARPLVAQLIDALAEAAQSQGVSPRSRRMRKLFNQFVSSDQFQGLQRCSKAVSAKDDDYSLSGLIHRYPNLYPHYLSDLDSSESGPQMMQQLQAERTRKFEQDLFQYSQQLLIPRIGSTAAIKNPTLLSNEQLEKAVRQFAGKAERGMSYRDEALGFLHHAAGVPNCRVLKDMLYSYITDALDKAGHGKYARTRFNGALDQHLRTVIQQHEQQPPQPFLLGRICTQVVDLLVPSPNKGLERHAFFTDLIGNLGPTFITSLLLRLVLLGRSAKHGAEMLKGQVERKFAEIFCHYEKSGCDGLEWFIHCLDNWMVASTIHLSDRGSYSDWTKLVIPRTA
jgi:hypothetical protein